MSSYDGKESYGYDQPSEPQVYTGPPVAQPPLAGAGAHPYQQPYQPSPMVVQPQRMASASSVTIVNAGLPPPVAAPQNIREWSTGMCACGDDCASLCFAFWCYPCFMCDLSSRLGENACGPFCCGALFNTAVRAKFRATYGIRGNVCNDVCTILCCEMCAMCQLKRELDAMETLQNAVRLQTGNVQVTQVQHQNVV